MFFKKRKKEEIFVDERLSHIAFIMDGNGRWAKKRAMPRIAGHHEGMKTVRKITRCADDLGVGVLTLYAFSTENWKRPKSEIEFLMNLPGKFLKSFLNYFKILKKIYYVMTKSTKFYFFFIYIFLISFKSTLKSILLFLLILASIILD